jgi:histidinol-phosphate/aromatic aminotransferase/cobyric acid decarboxylase-like protein
MGVGVERLLLTNGGAEAIALLAAELGGQVVEPEFGLYPRGGRPLWRSNPNSPTGRLAAADDRADVWDESFFALATGRWTRGDDAVVVGSLTKLLACPGLRLGYVLADSSFLERVRRRQPEWSVSGVAAASLPELLDGVDLGEWAAGVAQLRSALVKMLRSHGLTVRASDANWVLVERGGLREELAPHGVVVRDCSSFGMPGVTRISVPAAAGLERLDAALAAVSLNVVGSS